MPKSADEAAQPIESSEGYQWIGLLLSDSSAVPREPPGRFANSGLTDLCHQRETMSAIKSGHFCLSLKIAALGPISMLISTQAP